MKPAARIQSSIELMDEILKGTKPADTLIADYFKIRRYAGSKDRRAVNGQIYNILRNRAKLGWLAQKTDLDINAENLVFMDCVLNDMDVNNLFNGEQYAPAKLTKEQVDALPVIGQLDLATAPDPVRLEYPAWMDDDLRISLGDDFENCLQALNAEAPLDLRINSLHPDHDKAQDLLNKQNIDTTTTDFSPLCLRSAKKVKLGGVQAYKDGIVDIQDEGSQLIALLSGAKGCDLVMDFCAGAGGKTLALGAEMANKGHLYALDISSKRLYKMRRRLERAGVTNVILHPIKGETDPWLKQFENRVDRLLIDAPCSGVGAWRRAPESRWKMTSELLADLEGRQQRILQNAAHLVKSGGRMIYATCSLLKRENEDQIERFLNENKNFKLLPISQVWAQTLTTPCPFEGDFMSMRPDQHQSDGFFCAVLERL
ncbi:MAG: RsmB/NOP family class I SAM-dependent RNA methyltransferase [Terasakiella sp.]|uniref:RsmB/NOP family class I SAM-dependent RNA methyltransferase n=1 Tax=unclassified Terasakiella TaxID=2614952 RepID=UPI003B001923